MFKQLYLNRFRGEPAITKLDKPFTPNNKSSQNIATFMSSAYCLFIIRSFGFGSIFINYFIFISLALVYKNYSLIHYTKGTIKLYFI